MHASYKIFRVVVSLVVFLVSTSGMSTTSRFGIPRTAPVGKLPQVWFFFFHFSKTFISAFTIDCNIPRQHFSMEFKHDCVNSRFNWFTMKSFVNLIYLPDTREPNVAFQLHPAVPIAGISPEASWELYQTRYMQSLEDPETFWTEVMKLASMNLCLNYKKMVYDTQKRINRLLRILDYVVCRRRTSISLGSPLLRRFKEAPSRKEISTGSLRES